MSPLIAVLQMIWFRWWDEVGPASRLGMIMAPVAAVSILGLGLGPTVADLDGEILIDVGPDMVAADALGAWPDCDEPVAWRVDEGATPERFAEVDRALAEVADHSGLHFVHDQSASAERLISVHFVDRDHPTLRERNALGSAWTVMTHEGAIRTAEVMVGLTDIAEPGLSPEDRLVLVHELAHAVGVGHVDEVGAIMNPVINPSVDGLHQVDIEHLAEAGRRSGCEQP